MVLKNGNGNDKKFIFEKPDVEPLNAIEEELRSFLNSINNNTPVKVGITDGYNALKVAHQILEKINWTL
jgi:predicted dehydrogenase